MGTRYDEEERKRREAAMAALQRGGPDAQNLINGMGDEQKRTQAQASFDVLSARKRAEEALTGGEDTALRLIHNMATPEKRDRALDAYTQMTRDRKSPLYNPNARTYSQIQSAWKKEEEETRAREEGVRAAARNAAQVTDAYRRMKADDDAYRAKESAVTAATGAPLTAGGALGMLGRIGEIQDDGARADTLGAFLSNMGNVRSPYYNPYYGGSTNEYAQKIFGQASFSQEWVDENAGLSAYLIRDEFTGDVKKPGASATEMQNKAYAWHVIAKDIGVTQAAQEEAASLYEEAARAGASGYFDADWVEEIDWKDYPTLKKMLDGAAEKNPLRLSDAVPFSLEALYGAAYAGENGIEVLDARDYLTLAGNWASARARDERKAAWEEEQRAQLSGVEGFLYDNLGVGKKEYTDEDDARMREKQKAAPGEAQEEAAPGEAQEEATLGEAQEKATSGEAQEEATLGEAQEDAAAGGAQGAADREEGTDEETQAPQASGTEPTGSESTDAAARAALGAESTASEIVREAGYAPDEAQKAGDDSGKVNFWALSQAAQAERIANMTYEDKNRALQQGDYSFVENEDDRRAMHDIDAQIADIQTQLAVMEGTDDLGGLTMPEWLAKQDGLMRDIKKLEIRKAQIAFPDPNAQIPDASDQNMRPPDGWSYGQGLVNQRLTKEQEILDQADAQIADLQGQLSRGEIDAKTYNERYFEIDQQSRREKEQIDREISIIWMHMPTDEETRALRGGADRERLGLLYEKEIAIADGDTGRVKEINARLTEMGYSTEWPEVDAAAEAARAQRMERVRSLDADEVCEMLGYAPGTALTEADYQKAAEISTGWWETGEGLQAVGNWFLRVLAKDTVKKETGVSEAEALLRGEAVNDPDVYAKIAKDAAERVIAQTEGQPNADQYRDLMLDASILPATVGGAAQAGETILKAPTWTATHLTWAALNLSAGEELTLEQQRALHPGLFNSWVGGNEALNKWSITNRMTFGVGGVDPGLAEYEDIVAEVMLNYALSGVGSKVGNWRAKLYMSKFPGIEKTPKVLAEAYRMYEGTTKTITGTGFWLRGYMSNATEAAADGATSGQQALFGVLGATGSAVIENQNDIFRAMGFDAGDAAKGMAAYGKTIRYDEVKGYKLLGSVIFHSALDEALEELEDSPVSGALKYGVYGREQGMPVFGAGGIIDPAGAIANAAQGGLVGGIMLSLIHI